MLAEALQGQLGHQLLANSPDAVLYVVKLRSGLIGVCARTLQPILCLEDAADAADARRRMSAMHLVPCVVARPIVAPDEQRRCL